jgi:hypothetical protein
MKRSLLPVAVVLGIIAVAFGSSCTKVGQGPAAVQGTIAEFPDYPGAVQVEFKQGSDAEKGFARKSEAKWTSTAPYATVMAHYQKAITDGGWTVTATESKATKVEWTLAKGTSVAKIEIEQAAPVTIKIERNDR